MNNRIITVLIIVGAVLLIGVAVWVRTRPQSTQQVLCWVQPLRGHPTHQLTQIAFRTRCTELGYGCQIVGTEAVDAVGTIALAEQALARGNVVGMAVWPSNPSFNGFMESLGKRGIPVVVPHFPLEQKDSPGVAGLAGFDVAEAGANAAAEIGRAIGGKGTVAVSQGSFNLTENGMAAGFAAAMKAAHPEVVVLPSVEEGFDTVKAIGVASAVLQGHPEVVAALSTTGSGAITWAGAQRNSGRKIIIISVNCTRANVDLVKNGEVHALVAQPLWEESAEAATLLHRLVRGEKIPWWTKLPTPVVTKEGLAPYEALLDRIDAELRR